MAAAFCTSLAAEPKSQRADAEDSKPAVADPELIRLFLMDGSVITGQLLLPGSGGEITMERADGESRTARTDASGFFALPDATGTVRFAVEIDGTTRHTEWVVI